MSKRKVNTNDVKLKNGKYCYDWGGGGIQNQLKQLKIF